jgi:hypothetical protein
MIGDCFDVFPCNLPFGSIGKIMLFLSFSLVDANQASITALWDRFVTVTTATATTPSAPPTTTTPMREGEGTAVASAVVTPLVIVLIVLASVFLIAFIIAVVIISRGKER